MLQVEFPLPIVACNLMIEYADFYENIQASSETLQCPRCSASVPANPGVCANCGENVFQCHKCRSINYDEKDPFLCNICGFCKYAKFEYTLTCRPCCAVDPIESEDDRKKAVASINSLLDKADKVYKQLISNKPHLELLLVKISESSHDVGGSGQGGQRGGNGNVGSPVNYFIQQLAQKYCGDCKANFEELSKISQKIMSTRKELLAFDNSRKKKSNALSRASSVSNEAHASSASQARGKPNAGKCYGCAAASVEHCLTLLRALATKASSRHLLTEQGLISELLEHNLRRGSNTVRQEVRKLISFLTKDDLSATRHLSRLLEEKVRLAMTGRRSRPYPDMVESVRHEMSLLAYTVQREDTCWEERLKCVFRIFLLSTKNEKTSPVVLECITLPCLKILQGLVTPQGREREQTPGAREERQSLSYQGLSIDITKWLNGDPDHCFDSWDKRAKGSRASGPPREPERKKRDEVKGKRRPQQQSQPQPKSKEDVRKGYLAEKFGSRWLERTFQKATFPLDLSNSSWLRTLLFSPTSRSARQTACSMVEAFCSVHQRKKDVIDMLSGFLSDLRSAGEAAGEFCCLYQSLISSGSWREYLAVRGTLGLVASLITDEIEDLNRLEETTLSSDLAQG